MTSTLYQHNTTLSRCSHDVNALHGDASPCQIIRNRLSIHRSHLCTLVALHVGLSARISACPLGRRDKSGFKLPDLIYVRWSRPWAGTKLIPHEGRIRKTTRHLQQIFRDRSVFYGVVPGSE